MLVVCQQKMSLRLTVKNKIKYLFIIAEAIFWTLRYISLTPRLHEQPKLVRFLLSVQKRQENFYLSVRFCAIGSDFGCSCKQGVSREPTLKTVKGKFYEKLTGAEGDNEGRHQVDDEAAEEVSQVGQQHPVEVAVQHDVG